MIYRHMRYLIWIRLLERDLIIFLKLNLEQKMDYGISAIATMSTFVQSYKMHISIRRMYFRSTATEASFDRVRLLDERIAKVLELGREDPDLAQDCGVSPDFINGMLLKREGKQPK